LIIGEGFFPRKIRMTNNKKIQIEFKVKLDKTSKQNLKYITDSLKIIRENSKFLNELRKCVNDN